MINAIRPALLPLAAFAAAACGGSEQPKPLDEVRGTYRGVGIGSSEQAIARVFGEGAADESEGIAPSGISFVEMGGPTSIAGCAGIAPTVLRYERVSFLLCGAEAYVILVAESGARTRRGVSLGDDLDEVRRRYDDVECGDAPAGESLFGGQDTYPYCTVQVAKRRWLWFGRDPIKSIGVASVSFSP